MYYKKNLNKSFLKHIYEKIKIAQVVFALHEEQRVFLKKKTINSLDPS